MNTRSNAQRGHSTNSIPIWYQYSSRLLFSWHQAGKPRCSLHHWTSLAIYSFWRAILALCATLDSMPSALHLFLVHSLNIFLQKEEAKRREAKKRVEKKEIPAQDYRSSVINLEINCTSAIYMYSQRRIYVWVYRSEAGDLRDSQSKQQ